MTKKETKFHDWPAVRKQLLDAGELTEADVAAAKGDMVREVAAYRLAEVRKRLGVTQQQLAAQLAVAQSRVSALEHGAIDRMEFGTIRSYVEALGGTVRVVVDLDGEVLTVA